MGPTSDLYHPPSFADFSSRPRHFPPLPLPPPLPATAMPASNPIRRALLLLLLVLLAAFSARSDDQERQILLAFKSGLAVSSALDSWRTDSPPCNFAGVTCNSAGSISEIDLTDLGLAGPLPLASLCRLAALQKLAVGSNSFSGTIGAGLGSCTGLLQLDLSFNSLAGPVPDLSPLGQLRLLNLSDNGLSGPFPWASLKNLTELRALIVGDNPFDPSEFPAEILGLKKLESAYLSNISLTGGIPSAIGGLTELFRLELSTNSLTGGIPAEIGLLTKLTILEMYENQLTGTLPTGLGNLTKLEFFDASTNRLHGDLQVVRPLVNLISLQLYNNSLSGQIPLELGMFHRLVNLSLYSNQLTGPLPPEIGSWAEFNFIDVSENMLSGEIPPDMCKKGTMKKLLMLENNFSGKIPSTYGDCKTLIRFRVSINNLSGEVPAKIWGLPNAEIIDVAMNQLEGPITSDIGNAQTLGMLMIANNKFSGEIPSEISQATQLVTIDARDNQFTGKIPGEIGKLSYLNNLYLQNNRLSGNIPSQLASCRALVQLNLAANSISGIIPSGLGSLQSFNYLNLSDNQLSGDIPASLSNLKLSTLDLTNNHLSGPVPAALSVGAYSRSFLGNPGLCSITDRNLPPCSPPSKKSGNLRTLITCFLAVLAAVLASLGFFFYANKRQADLQRPKQDSWDLKPYQVLTFTEQDVLTGIRQENLIGKGGSGSVYRVSLPGGKELAVKHLWSAESVGGGKSSAAMLGELRRRRSAELEAEVAALSSVRHVNVVKLYCSITSEDSSLLVYEFLPNGSLWDRLHTCEKMELDWVTRYDIALGAAKGLEYLHHGCNRPIIHRDVKSSNILLDDFFKPRIADFGLAKIVRVNSGMDSTHVVAGTYGYIAPEYGYTNKVNEKSDVYSFGVVLMELVTGKRPIEPEYGENKDIVGWISSQMTSRESIMAVVDKRIPESLSEDVVEVLRIAVLCTARLPALRPTMRTVVQMLEDAEPCKLVSIVSVKGGKEEGDKGMKSSISVMK